MATFTGSFHASGVPSYGFIDLDADGSGDLNSLRSTYTVTPKGMVQLKLQSTQVSNILA